ncbi:MAG TPA: hypothetical protein VFN91_01605, partial [Myxococcaceae bacterium]|nr:hypothetical protein [Myxococcaceae bacterium]
PRPPAMPLRDAASPPLWRTPSGCLPSSNMTGTLPLKMGPVPTDRATLTSPPQHDPEKESESTGPEGQLPEMQVAPSFDQRANLGIDGT